MKTDKYNNKGDQSSHNNNAPIASELPILCPQEISRHDGNPYLLFSSLNWKLNVDVYYENGMHFMETTVSYLNERVNSDFVPFLWSWKVFCFYCRGFLLKCTSMQRKGKHILFLPFLTILISRRLQFAQGMHNTDHPAHLRVAGIYNLFGS